MPKGPGGVIFFGPMMMREPSAKRVISFIDGQNLFFHAKAAFGYTYPNYDPQKLGDETCRAHESDGWINHGVRFYTGVPDSQHSSEWLSFWNRRTLAMERVGIRVTTRRLRYRPIKIPLPDGTTRTEMTAQEKGIDLRLALDVVRLAYRGDLDVAVIFSQDQDFAEVATEIRSIARSRNAWLKIVSAFPSGPNASASRGIENTDWFRMDKAFYDACIDHWDYRK